MSKAAFGQQMTRAKRVKNDDDVGEDTSTNDLSTWSNQRDGIYRVQIV